MNDNNEQVSQEWAAETDKEDDMDVTEEILNAENSELEVVPKCSSMREFDKHNIPCCFPGCQNSGTLFPNIRRTLKRKKIAPSEIRASDFRMFRLISTKFVWANRNNRNSIWLKLIGYDVDSQCECDNCWELFLCDGHFSPAQYFVKGRTVGLSQNSVPDILLPNPSPIANRIIKAVSLEGKPISSIGTIDLRNSQVFAVPTRFNPKINKNFSLEDYDNLRIVVSFKVCCICALPVGDDAIKLVEDGQRRCTDFGKVVSIMNTLTETDLLSAYACSFCADKVLSCFHRWLDINVKLILAVRRLDESLNVTNLPSQLPCHKCGLNQNSPTDYRNHLMEHFMESDEIGFDSPAEPVETTGKEPETALCEVCGLEVEYGKIGSHVYAHGLKKNEQEKKRVTCHICGELRMAGTIRQHIKRHDPSNYSRLNSKKKLGSEMCGTVLCPTCGVNCFTLVGRHEHRKKEHGWVKKTNHRCYFCENVFRSANIMRRHFRKFHPDRMVARCEDCKLDFFHENSLLIHNATRHPELHEKYKEHKKQVMLQSAVAVRKRKRKELEDRISGVTEQDVYNSKMNRGTNDEMPENILYSEGGDQQHQKWGGLPLESQEEKVTNWDEQEVTAEDGQNVEYVEQVSATEYLVLEGNVVKKYLQYM